VSPGWLDGWIYRGQLYSIYGTFLFWLGSLSPRSHLELRRSGAHQHVNGELLLENQSLRPGAG